jgi:diketogulonate reductase-like aldo/keto reductase
MEEVKKRGQARSIGVSNYLRSDVEATLKSATDPPVLNQLEYHPYLQRAGGYIPWLHEHGLQVGSFKGLTPAFRCPNGPLQEPLTRIAKAHGKTENAVLLAWIIQSNIVAVTTTTKAERLDEYAQALNIKLTPDEFKEITDIGNTYHFRTSWGEHFDMDDRS